MTSLLQENAGKVRLGKKVIARERNKKWRQNNLVGYLFISPWLIGFLLLTSIPMAASLVLSFTHYDILTGNVEWTGLENFKRMFYDDPRYWRAVWATLKFAFYSVPLKLLFALLVAELLYNARRFVGIYRAVYYAPSIVGGSVAVAVMWRQIFAARGGLVNDIFLDIGLTPKIWLGDLKYAIWTLVLMAVWQFGSPMLIFLAGLKQIPNEYYEAAAIDGAGPISKFTRITLPLLTPVIFFNLVMQFIFSFLTFTQAYVVSGGTGRPLDTTLFYNLYIYIRSFGIGANMGYGSAMAWVMLVVIATFTGVIFLSSRFWVFYDTSEN